MRLQQFGGLHFKMLRIPNQSVFAAKLTLWSCMLHKSLLLMFSALTRSLMWYHCCNRCSRGHSNILQDGFREAIPHIALLHLTPSESTGELYPVSPSHLPSFLSILQTSTASTASSACCWSDCPALHWFPGAQQTTISAWGAFNHLSKDYFPPCLHSAWVKPIFCHLFKAKEAFSSGFQF